MKSVLYVLVVSLLMTACGGGSGSSPPPPPPPPATYGITGTVAGLNGTVVLQRNGANDQSVAANGAITLGSGLAAGASYAITVLTQPANPAQTCAVANGTGSLTANVTNVAITCTNVPLLLNATLPTNSSTDVARDVAPLLTFSRSLDGSTVTPANITLTSGAGTQPITLATTDNAVVMSHASKLLPMTEYTVAVSTAVRGSAAEQLANSMSALFVTRDGVWGDQVEAETNTAQIASAPQLAIDAAGNAMAVWLHYDGTRNNVWASRYLRVGGWQTPALIETGTGNATAPQVAVNASGAAVAVWEQVTFANTDVYINQYTPAGGWSGAQLLASAVAGETKEPVVSLEPNGNIHVAYVQQTAGTFLPRSRHYEGGNWTSALLDNSSGSAGAIQQTVDDAGNVLYVWRHNNGTDFDVYAARRTQGVLTAAAAIETGAGSAVEMQIAGDASGNAHAVWIQWDGTRNNVWTSRFTVGAGWSAPLLLETANGTVDVPQIALSTNGDAYAVWIQNNGTNIDVQSARYSAGAWSPPSRVDTNASSGGSTPTNTGDADAPRIAVDASGNATAVWLQEAAGFITNVWCDRYIPGRGWGTPAWLERQNVDAHSARIAIGTDGDALAVWTQGISPNISVWSNRFE